MMISIVIPLFNAENYIEKCLESLERQIYTDFEVLLVNDGSNDKSLDVVKNYQRNSKLLIKIINQKNSGVSVARNNGLIECSGEYICFIDSDDVVSRNYLNRMISVFNESDANMVVCGTMVVNEEFNIALENDKGKDKKIKMQIFNSSQILTKYLHREIKPGIGSFIVKKKVLDNNNIRFTNKSKYSEDVEFIYKALCKSKIIAYIHDELYFYRIRNTSAMSKVDANRYDGFVLMQKLEKYFEKECIEFSTEFNKFGVARWVWATLWQIALGSNDYKQFINNSKKYNPGYYLKKLNGFPETRISISSKIFCISPFIYYKLVKLVAPKHINRNFTA